MTTHTLRTQTTRRWRRFFAFGQALEGSARESSNDDKQAPGNLTFVTSLGNVVAARVVVANTFADRFTGLLKRDRLGRDEGLLLSPGGSIHTLGMRFAIDVLFLDRHMRVLKVASAMPPWRAVLAPAGTEFTLELASGRSAAAAIGIGMRLLWSETGVGADSVAAGD